MLLVAEGDSAAIVDDAGLGRHISPDESVEKLVEMFDNMIDHYDEFDVHKDEAIRLMHDKYSRQKIAEELNKELHRLCGK